MATPAGPPGVSCSPFDPLVDAYDAARPTYPDELYDALDRLAGPLAGALVVDVGAGTGIATRALLARGARVLALDIGPAMLRRLRDRTPDALGPVVADGSRLPLPDATADLVCYAQAWHWMDVDAGTAAAAAVLRPGGALACWWNDVDAENETWWRAQQDRLEMWNTAYTRGYRDTDYAGRLEATGRFASVETFETSWTRELDIDTYETWLRSKSYVAALGDRLDDFVAAERASLTAAFPTGVVREPFRTWLAVARLSARRPG